MPKNFTEINQAFEINTANQSNTFFRLNGIPIDKTSVYGSLTDAQNYANNSKNAYAGQVIAVITDTDAQAYIITPTPQTGGNYLRPIADLSKIEQDIADLKELPEHKEVKMANEVGSTEDTSYSIKIDSSDNLCLIKNNTDGTTNSLVIGSGTVKAQHSKTVEEDPVIFPVGQQNTLPSNDEAKFKNIDELAADMLPEENRGAKVQHLFDKRQLTTGGIFYDCPTFKQNDSKFGIKFVLDKNGNGIVDLDYSINSMFDVTYDPDTMKIVRFGDFYFYIVYDDANKPIGALCIGRPEGVLTNNATNFAASWRFFNANDTTSDVPYYTTKADYNNGNGTPVGTFNINNAELDNAYHVDSYGNQWLPRLNVFEKSDFPMSPLPVLRFNKNPFSEQSTCIYKDRFLTSGLDDDEFAATYNSNLGSWNWAIDKSTPVAIYKLVELEFAIDENITETRYYIVLSKNNNKISTCPITNYQFTLGNATYEISKDCTKVILSGQNLILSNILESFDLLKIFNGKGPLLSANDEYMLPPSTLNLWGSYWLKDPTNPDRQNYDIRVGLFDPAATNYEYQEGTTALNPAGNYCIGKLESFHPLRINMTGDPKVDELYIRTATIKGFKTSMDWPNASAVAPRDCSLRSGTVWIQFIWAYPVKEDKPRLFFRVLFDGYVNNGEHNGLSGNYRYPWSQCYELTNIGAVEEAKKYTDEAIIQAISELEIPETPEVQQANTDTLGGIKIGYEQNNKNYPVKLDNTGKAFVEVPWTDTNTTDLTGDGSALTNLNANNITTGIIDEERLPKKYMTELQIEFEGATLTSYTLSKAVASIRFISDKPITIAQNGDLTATKFGEYLAKSCYINGALRFSAVDTGTVSNYCAIPYTIQISDGNIIYKGTVMEYTSTSTGTNTVTYYVMDLALSLDPDTSTIKYTVISSVEI